jgi:hypothetical protein
MNISMVAQKVTQLAIMRINPMRIIKMTCGVTVSGVSEEKPSSVAIERLMNIPAAKNVPIMSRRL